MSDEIKNGEGTALTSNFILDFIDEDLKERSLFIMCARCASLSPLPFHSY